MRSKVVFRPGAGGLNTDLPASILKPDAAVYAMDAIYYNGLLRTRWGWTFDSLFTNWPGTTTKGAGSYRAKFTLGAVTRTVCSGTTATPSAKFWIENGASGTEIQARSTPGAGTGAGGNYLPRCQYKDELIFCGSDGRSNVVRYSGASVTSTFSLNNPPGATTGESTITYGASTFTPTPVKGQYADFYLGRQQIRTSARILGSGTSSVTIEDGLAVTAPVAAGNQNQTGFFPLSLSGFPCQVIYETGSATVTTTAASTAVTAAGFGTAWNDVLQTIYVDFNPGRSLIWYDNTVSKYKIRFISGVTSATALSLLDYESTTGVVTATTTKGPYSIVVQPTWTDACVHKGSLCGTGVAWFPNRVYLAPPGWNMAYPPGATYPFDFTQELAASSKDRWLLDFIDVPGADNGDPCVALLSTPGPLLVLKRSSVYAIHGTYPNYDLSLVTSGNGCLQRTAAISVDGGAYWAGEQGVFTYRGGRVVSLTSGKIEREWRALARGWQSTSNLSIGVAAGQLVVSISGLKTSATAGAINGPDGTAPSSRTYVYDIASDQWVSRHGNVTTNSLHSARVPGEIEALFAMIPTTGRVYDLAPCFSGTRVTDRATQTVATAVAQDGDNVYGALAVWTPTNLAESAGIDGEARLVDLSAVTNVYDPSSAAASVSIKVACGGGLRSDSTGGSLVVSTPLQVFADTADSPDRNRVRIGRSGRLHQLRFEQGTFSASLSKLELHEAVLNFRDARSRS